jgi:hypothetical protein
MPAWGPVKSTWRIFPKYVWKGIIHHLISMNILLLEKRRDLMSTPFKMGNKFCLVRRGVRSLSILRSKVYEPYSFGTPSYEDQKCFNVCWGVVMFTLCFTMGKAHGWCGGDSPNVGPDSATSKTHVLLTKTLNQHQVNSWDFHQSTNVQAKTQ